MEHDQGDQSHTFTCFPHLPVELRLKIWRHARPIRILEIFLHDFTRFSTRFAPPTILYVNREFRTEALKTYEIFELDPLWGLIPKGSNTAKYKFIFNRELDSIYLSKRSCGHALHEDVNLVFDRIRALGLRSIAVEDGIIEPHKPYRLFRKALKLEFIEELIIVVPYRERPLHMELLKPIFEVQEAGISGIRPSRKDFQRQVMRKLGEYKVTHSKGILSVVRTVQFLSYHPQRDLFCYSAALVRTQASDIRVSYQDENQITIVSDPTLTHQEECSATSPSGRNASRL